MIPPFDVEGGLPLAAARFASVAGLVGAAGSLVYADFVVPADLPARTTTRLGRLCTTSLVMAFIGALAWLAAQTWDFADSLAPSALWLVLTSTLFGHLVAARLVLLVLVSIALWRRFGRAAAVLACLALLLQAGHSHALAMGGAPILLASSGLHILAAGIWLGGLPGLWIAVAAGAPWSSRAARRFSVVGLVCVGVLLATAALQFSTLVVNVPGLVGTAYGWMAGTKMVLLAALLAMAARNRLRLTRRLPDVIAMRGLANAILLEMVLGLAVLAAAGVLTELQPAMHTQKLWPFPWVPSLDAAREDPDIARETLLAGSAIVLSLGALAGAVFWSRRRRWPSLIAGCVAFAAMVAAAPHLSPLLVPTVPTRFYRSPTGFAAASIAQGAALYPAQCAACHGAGGHGDGPLARTLPVPPADLTAAHLWAHTDGELFWWLTHGIESPRGLAMAGFPNFSDDERWSLIDFIRARNAGLTLGAGGAWATQLQAPDFAIACNGATTKLSALRGGIVRIVLAPAAQAPSPNPDGVTVIPAAASASGYCHAEDSAVPAAYAIAGAVSVLIDANGWLRAASNSPRLPDAALAKNPMPAERAPTSMPADMKM